MNDRIYIPLQPTPHFLARRVINPSCTHDFLANSRPNRLRRDADGSDGADRASSSVPEYIGVVPGPQSSLSTENVSDGLRGLYKLSTMCSTSAEWRCTTAWISPSGIEPFPSPVGAPGESVFVFVEATAEIRHRQFFHDEREPLAGQVRGSFVRSRYILMPLASDK